MSRLEEFEERLDGLLDEFSDLSYKELADSLDFYASYCHNQDD